MSKQKITDAILTMDKLYWDNNNKIKNMKNEDFIDLVKYCKQMVDKFYDEIINEEY